jgi:hypothetical protein
MSLIIRPPNVMQPYGGAAVIDYGNPICAGLQDWFTPQTPERFVAGTGTIARTTGPNGQAFTGSSLQVNGKVSSTNWQTFTILGVVTTPSVITSGYAAISSTADAGGFGIWVGISTSNFVVDNFETQTNIGAAVALKPYVLVATYTPATIAGYVNGVFGGSAGNGTDTGTGVLAAMATGAGNTFWTGTVSLAAWWNRVLSANEILSVSRNPWQLFLPTARRIWVSAVAANDTFMGQICA